MATTNPIDQVNLSDSIQVSSGNAQIKQPGKFAGALGKAAKVAGSILLPGFGGMVGDVLGGMGVGALGSDPMQYLRLQQRMNAESRAFESMSAVLKAKHDAAMDSIRNISH